MSRRPFGTSARWVLACLLTMTLAACGGSEPGASDANGAGGAGGGDGGERRFLSVGTAPPGGAFFVVGGALADVLGAENESWQVTAEATKGTQENLRRLAAGDLDVALANSAITYFAVRGEEGWDEALPIRSVMTLAPNVALFLAKADSGITRLADLRGKRVVVGPAGAGFEYFLRPILAAHGISYDDFTALPAGTQASTVDMLADGSADAVFLGGAVPTASITQASSSMDLVFLPYEEDAVAELTARYPFFQRATIPADTYRGQTEAYAGLDVGSMHLVTAESVPADLIEQVTRTLFEHRDAVVEKHPAGRAIQPGNVVRDVGTEFHPGAVAFYEEEGIWKGDGDGDGAADATEPAADVDDSSETEGGAEDAS